MHGPRRVRSRFSAQGSRTPIEDWGPWFATVVAREMRAIIHSRYWVAEYDRPGVLETYPETNHWPRLVRLATAELILRLMQKGWDLERLFYPGVSRVNAHSHVMEPVNASRRG